MSLRPDNSPRLGEGAGEDYSLPGPRGYGQPTGFMISLVEFAQQPAEAQQVLDGMEAVSIAGSEGGIGLFNSRPLAS